MTETAEQTIAELRRAIKSATAVYVFPRFGVFEKRVRIYKAEAYWMIKAYEPTVTASDLGMSELFSWDGSDLLLG